MAKTLAELRAEANPKLPTRSERLCLNLDLLGRVQRLSAERAELVVNTLGAEKPEVEEDHEAARESKARVRKASEGPADTQPPEAAEEPAMPPRVTEIDAELVTLWDKMREYEGDLLLRGIDGGRWQTFKDDHPPREGHQGDRDNGGGVVNTTDLMASLADWAAAWNDEDLHAGDWSGWLRQSIAPADLSMLVRRVVEMQENRVIIPPKVLTGSRSTTSLESDAG